MKPLNSGIRRIEWIKIQYRKTAPQVLAFLTIWFQRAFHQIADFSSRLITSTKHTCQRISEELDRRITSMIGPMEKGIEKARLQKPTEGVYEGVDLRTLPKYICFRAAMLQNKLMLQHVILILIGILAVHFISTRFEIYSLYGQLRSKEYILAPGVQDFTPASPQTVPDSHVANAVTQFLGLMGNVTAANIDEQYEALSDSMDNKLKIRFLAEASAWMKKVKEEGISELLTVTQREIRSNKNGLYKVTALGRRDTYVGSEYLGHVNEAVEMVLQLVPPKDGKRWYLQINELTRQSMDAYRTKKTL